MELSPFLDKLGNVKKGSGNKYTALCPAHQDKERSLSITADHEKILVKCFAGCTTEAVMESLGLSMADLFFGNNSKPTTPKIVKTYDYTDEAGTLLFQVCRLHPKSFRQRHKNSKGEWVWDMKGVKRVLYHLPDIVRAETVYFVEGEKDADALIMECGQIATTSPGGANAWKDDLAEPLIGKKVILIPDNDEAGYTYMREAAVSLMGKAELSCILLPCKDISDWLAEKHHFDELEGLQQDISRLLGGKQPKYELIDGAITWQHKPVEFKAENLRRERTGLHGKSTILYKFSPLAWSVFNLERSEERAKLAKLAYGHLKPELKKEYTETDIKRDFDIFCSGLWQFYLSYYSPELIYGEETLMPLTFYLRPYIMRGGGTIIFAAPGRGKSNTALLWAQSINSGIQKFWNVEQAPVLVINLERSKETIQRRLSCINKVLGLPAITPLRILNARGKSLSEVIDACRKAIKQYNIEIIFLDSISRAGFGDLTENRPVNAIIDALSGLCDTWVALAHTPRADETHVYGGVMFEAGADIVIKLNSAISNNGTLGLGYEITKANDIAYGGIAIWTMEFNDTGLIGFRKANAYEFPEIEGLVKKPLPQAIIDYILAQETADATATEVSDSIDRNRGQVADILKHSGLFVQTRVEGRKVYYGVKEM